VVRRLVAEHNLDPSTITGTGAGGRITRDDVLAVIEKSGGGAAAPAQPAAPAPPAAAPAAPAAPPAAPAAPAAPRAAAAPAPAAPAAAAAAAAATDRDQVVPFTNIRRRTAEHMTRSKSTSAHALVAIEVDYDNVDRARKPAKDAFRAEEGVNLTYLPFVARAVIDALREFPHLNASVGDEALIVHQDVHLGFAVDLSFEGLVVPVVHNADGKRLRALARAVADLADRARGKRLLPDDIAGGTFTITNVGSYGTLLTMPIVNQPQIAILSTDGVKKRPVVIELPDGSDAIVVHPVGNLAMSWDHRAVDGAYASAFMQKVKELLETRDWAQEIA
jgi:2-oxoglutarate dehydrogenase E2 component (dihydrolipoamide succinyltransferase)